MKQTPRRLRVGIELEYPCHNAYALYPDFPFSDDLLECKPELIAGFLELTYGPVYPANIDWELLEGSIEWIKAHSTKHDRTKKIVGAMHVHVSPLPRRLEEWAVSQLGCAISTRFPRLPRCATFRNRRFTAFWSVPVRYREFKKTVEIRSMLTTYSIRRVQRRIKEVEAWFEEMNS